jgi:hypothetical protein
MNKGLVKAFLNDDDSALLVLTSWAIQGQKDIRAYCHAPERLGMTIAYGEITPSLPPAGTTVEITPAWVVRGPRTKFVLVNISIDIFSRMTTASPHITLAWVEGAAPVVAGREGREFLEILEKFEGGFVDAQNRHFVSHDGRFEAFNAIGAPTFWGVVEVKIEQFSGGSQSASK